MTEQLDLANITDQTAQLLSEYRIPSAAIGILYDGTISDFAVGLMNLSTSEPATTDTIYQCGSMTKTWTALAFMQLVDEGKVGLDEPVRRRMVNAHHLVALVRAGAVFVNGKLVERPEDEAAGEAPPEAA